MHRYCKICKITWQRCVLLHRQPQCTEHKIQLATRSSATRHNGARVPILLRDLAGTCSKSSLARAAGGGLPSQLSAVKRTLEIAAEPLALSSRLRFATTTAAAMTVSQCTGTMSMTISESAAPQKWSSRNFTSHVPNFGIFFGVLFSCFAWNKQNLAKLSGTGKGLKAIAKTLRIFLVPKTFPERFHTNPRLRNTLFYGTRSGKQPSRSVKTEFFSRTAARLPK